MQLLYGDLTISSGILRTADFSVTGVTDVDGELNIGSGSTFTANGSSDIDGTLTIVTSTFDANGTFDATNGNVTFSSTGTLQMSEYSYKFTSFHLDNWNC